MTKKKSNFNPNLVRFERKDGAPMQTNLTNFNPNLVRFELLLEPIFKDKIPVSFQS